MGHRAFRDLLAKMTLVQVLIPTCHNRPFLHFLSLPLQKWKPFHFIFETFRSRYSNFHHCSAPYLLPMKSAKYSILQAKWHSFYPNGGKFPNPHKILEFCKKCAFWVLFRKSFGEALPSWAAFLWALFAAFSSTIGRDVQLLHNNCTQSATFFYGFYLDNMMSTFSSNAIIMSFVSKSIHIFIRLQWIQSSQNYSFAMIFKTHDFHNISLVPILVSTVASGCINTSLWSDLLY